MKKYLSQDSIEDIRGKCRLCAVVAEVVSVIALPYLVVWLVIASLA